MKRKIKNFLYVFLALLSVATAVTLPVLARKRNQCDGVEAALWNRCLQVLVDMKDRQCQLSPTCSIYKSTYFGRTVDVVVMISDDTDAWIRACDKYWDQGEEQCGITELAPVENDVLAAALYPVEDGSNMAFAMKVILSDLRRIQIEDEVLLKSVFESFLTFGHAHISLAAL